MSVIITIYLVLAFAEFCKFVKNDLSTVLLGLLLLPFMPFVTAYRIRKVKPKTAKLLAVLWLLIYNLLVVIYLLDHGIFTIQEILQRVFGFLLVALFSLGLLGLIKKAFD